MGTDLFSTYAEQAERVVDRLAAGAATGAGVNGDPALAGLLWDPAYADGGAQHRALMKDAVAARERRWRGAVFPVAPLYVSSICAEQCLYCNYRAGNKGVGVVRRRLADDEVAAEAAWLIEERGLRAVELVYASDPLATPAVIARHVARVRTLLDAKGGGLVGLSAEPLQADDYRRLAGAGLDFAVVWMETYDRARYAVLHPGRTRKADYAGRLDVYGRMLAGGLPHVGMGVLSGLGPWRHDWAMLMQHEAWLAQHYGRGAAILGIPRLNAAPGAPVQSRLDGPDDAEFLLAGAVHALFAPDTRPFVSTRETWNLCLELARGGGCLFTLDCSTIPGGYTLATAGAQFPAHSFDAPTHAGRLGEAGLTPRWDWSFGAPA